VDPVARTHYGNVGFDLELRPQGRRGEGERLDRQIRQLSVQGLLGARTGDAALVLTEIADSFLEHLDACGIPVPRVLHHPDIDRDSRFRPFGWSAEAIELNRLHRRPTAHPALPVIRRVNSRSFGLELERELFPEVAAGAIVDEISALETQLSGPSPSGEWLVKGEFGNAGLANRRLRSRELSEADRRFVDRLLADTDRIVVEPWLPRERDWSVVFEVPFDASTLRKHETTYTRDGALIGAVFEPEGTEEARWRGELEEMAERVALRLETEGYFGPVCVDAFSWRDGDRSRLRPLVDLNCRRSMSDGVYRLWRQVAPDRVFYYRFFNRRKLTLPRELPRALAALGNRGYDRDRRRGTLLVSPPDHAKVGVILAGESRREALALEVDLRARFES
jgi:hypothetical protein